MWVHDCIFMCNVVLPFVHRMLNKAYVYNKLKAFGSSESRIMIINEISSKSGLNAECIMVSIRILLSSNEYFYCSVLKG